MNNNRPKAKVFLLKNQYLTASVLTIAIIVISLFICHIAPFGDKTLAVRDANIQYLDFFAFFKDVLLKKNSFEYSLSNTLGDSNFVLFSYYLFSPLNLLVLLFDKSNLNSLLSVLLLSKAVLATCSCLFFLSKWFPKNSSQKISLLNTYLAVVFGCSQYLLSQGNNIMWLDGVYLLPLILLGTHRTVSEEHFSFLFILSTAFSVFFNWYTGAINILFACFWFVVEWAIVFITIKKKRTLKTILRSIARFGGSLMLALLISSCVLIPTLISIKSGRGSVDFKNLAFSFSGDILSSLQAYLPGISNVDSNKILYLFSGSITLLLIVSGIVSKETPKKVRLFAAFFIITILMLFYWKPLFFVFSIFKNADSYWFRYSYVAIFSILFICRFLTEYGVIQKKHIWKSAILVVSLLAILQFSRSFYPSLTYYYCALLLTIGFIATIQRKKLQIPLLGMLIFGEILGSSTLLLKNNSIYSVQDYKKYVTAEEHLVSQVFESDQQLFRINQTSTRNMSPDNLTANYNEGLAFGYNSISGYTSDPDENQRNILESLGYRKNGDNFNIVNTSIIGSDSLLGVKYILSDYQVANYKQITQNSTKNVYRNDYALPMFFSADSVPSLEPKDYSNTFEYQNAIFRNLSNLDLDVYSQLPLSSSQKGSEVDFTFSRPSSPSAIYGNIEWEHEFNGSLVIGEQSTGYAKWLSPSVFYVPDDESSFRLTTSDDQKAPIRDAYIYAANLSSLEKISSKIRKNEILSSYSGNTFVLSPGGNSHYILSSIPWNNGWSAYHNGKKLELLKTSAGFIYFVNPGEGEIQLVYRTPGLKNGLILSLFGFLVTITLAVLSKKRTSLSA